MCLHHMCAVPVEVRKDVRSAGTVVTDVFKAHVSPGNLTGLSVCMPRPHTHMLALEQTHVDMCMPQQEVRGQLSGVGSHLPLWTPGMALRLSVFHRKYFTHRGRLSGSSSWWNLAGSWR